MQPSDDSLSLPLDMDGLEDRRWERKHDASGCQVNAHIENLSGDELARATC